MNNKESNKTQYILFDTIYQEEEQEEIIVKQFDYTMLFKLIIGILFLITLLIIIVKIFKNI